MGSNPTRCATSEQAMYRLLRLFLKVRARSRRCSSFPNRNRLRWVAIWVRRFAADLSRYGEISILTVPSTSEQSPLCSSFPTATRCAGLAVGVLPCGPHPNISGSSRIRQRCKRKSSQFCRRSSTLSWAIRLLDRRFFSVINCEASSSSNAWKALCHTGAAFREPAGGASR